MWLLIYLNSSSLFYCLSFCFLFFSSLFLSLLLLTEPVEILCYCCYFIVDSTALWKSQRFYKVSGTHTYLPLSTCDLFLTCQVFVHLTMMALPVVILCAAHVLYVTLYVALSPSVAKDVTASTSQALGWRLCAAVPRLAIPMISLKWIVFCFHRCGCDVSVCGYMWVFPVNGGPPQLCAL